MDAIEHLEERKWVKPSSYAGFSPDGDFNIVGQHRDSDALARSNYQCAFDQLREIAAKYPPPPEEIADDSFPSRGEISPRSAGWVYDWRASHWAVGWVEELMVRADAPEEVLEAAGEIVCSLADYPVLDEDHFSELEFEEAAEYWAQMSVADRLEVMEGSGVSIFAARHNYMPRDDNGYIYERLTSA